MVSPLRLSLRLESAEPTDAVALPQGDNTPRGRPAVMATASLKRVVACLKLVRSFGKTSRPFWNTWYFGMATSNIHGCESRTADMQ